MVDFPPLVPSARWFANFLQSRVYGLTEKEACIGANLKLESGKEFGRFSLRNPNGEIKSLSLAIEGGGRRLRTIEKVSGLQLSNHGDWRKTHLNTIETCLGRKPFFREIQPHIADVYNNYELSSLEEFNSAIFMELYSFLMGNIIPADLSSFFANPVLTERGKEIAEKIDCEISILQALASFGRETLLGIYALE